MYVKVEGGTAVKYTLGQLRSENPNVSFPSVPNDSLLAEYNVYPLKQTDRPAYDPLTQKVVELDPAHVDGQWQQAWEVVELTNEEKDELRSRVEVTMRQARLALFQQGLLSQVETAIAALPDAERIPAQIEWEYGSNVQRSSPWVVKLTAALGLTPSDVDQLFDLASRL